MKCASDFTLPRPYLKHEAVSHVYKLLQPFHFYQKEKLKTLLPLSTSPDNNMKVKTPEGSKRSSAIDFAMKDMYISSYRYLHDSKTAEGEEKQNEKATKANGV